MTEQTFTLTVTGMEHAEWQGTIQARNGAKADFQSLLELIKIVNAQLEEQS